MTYNLLASDLCCINAGLAGDEGNEKRDGKESSFTQYSPKNNTNDGMKKNL
jgi:hypothetical protein